MFGQGFNYGFLGGPPCFTDTTDIFKDNSGVALYTLDYDASDAGGATGKFSEGVVYNGSSSRIDLPNVLSGLTNTYSFSIWAKIPNTDNFSFFSSTTSTAQSTYNNLIRFALHQNGNYYFSFGDIYGGRLTGVSPSSWTDGNWHNFVFVSTSTQKLVYVDGSLFDSASSTKSVSGLTNIILGHYGTNYADGNIDQIRIFNKGISSSEVTTLYNETKNTTNTLQILGGTSCIATYPFDGSSADLSGNYSGTDTNILYKYDGTPTNVDFGVGGKSLYGARFNGSSSKIALPSLGGGFTGSSSRSVSAWVKITSTPSGSIAIFNSGGAATNQSFGYFIGTSRQVIISYYNRNWETSETISLDTWNHILFTYNGGAVETSSNSKIYINGTLATLGSTTGSATGSINTPDTNHSIGVYSPTNSLYFNGSIDQVRIFSKALSSSEVSKLYGNGAGEIACAYTSTTDNIALPITNTAYYKLDNNSKDSARSTGKFNEGAIFNGSSSRIATGLTLPADSTMSFSFWLKSASNSSGNNYFLSDFDSSGSNNSSRLSLAVTANNGFRIWMSNGSSNWNSTDAISLSSYINVWINLVVTIDGTDVKVYINGGTPTTLTSTVAFGTAGSRQQYIGGVGGNNAASYEGSIDQVRIYDVALSSADVSNLYAETASDTNTLSFPSGQTAIATYQLDGDSTDLSGNYNGTDTDIKYAYDGTDTNVEYRFGRFGQAAVFNGSSSKIDTGISSISSPFAVSMWINEDVLDSGIFFGNWNSTSSDMYWQTTSDGRLRISIDGFSEQYFGTAGDVKINTWHHIAVTLSGGSYEVFLDGNSLGTSTTSVTTFSSGQNFMIGNSSKPSTPVPFDGSIDQVRIYDAALTSSQVTELYNEKPEVDTSNFKTVLYEGNGSTQYISNVGMDLETDGGLVWIKNRYSTQSHRFYDSVRGANLQISSNQTASEGNSGGLTSFDSNGFSLDNWASVNTNGNTYVSWVWKGGGDAVSNTDGTITSQVSANTDAGFSIVKWTGDATSNPTVGHLLNQEPDLYIVKELDNGTVSWLVGGNSTLFPETATTASFLRLNTNDDIDQTGIDTFGNSGQNLIKVGARTNNGEDSIAYCFHSVAGYSKIGTYSGTGSTGNAITGLGFQPNWLMVKRTNASGNSWLIVDNKRVESNGNLSELFANTTTAETGTGYDIDFTSDGFTLNTTTTNANASGTDNYIYMAFK